VSGEFGAPRRRKDERGLPVSNSGSEHVRVFCKFSRWAVCWNVVAVSAVVFQRDGSQRGVIGHDIYSFRSRHLRQLSSF